MHVGILRAVELYALFLAGVKLRESIWVSVPVVAIELYHESKIADVGINAEPVVDHGVPFVYQAKLIHGAEPGDLSPCGSCPLLHNVHVQELLADTRVGIAATQRAEVVKVASGAGSMPTKLLATRFAGHDGHSAGLCRIPATRRAESRSGTAWGAPERDAALFASLLDPHIGPVQCGPGGVTSLYPKRCATRGRARLFFARVCVAWEGRPAHLACSGLDRHALRPSRAADRAVSLYLLVWVEVVATRGTRAGGYAPRCKEARSAQLVGTCTRRTPASRTRTCAFGHRHNSTRLPSRCLDERWC